MRPVTLFTGQWADLPLETLCQQAVEFGYDGLELACWGDHFEVDQATDAYCQAKRELLAKHDLALFSISNHLVGQAVCDAIDSRHQAILPPRIFGDGDPEGVRQRAAAEMIATGQAARPARGGRGQRLYRLLDLAPALFIPASIPRHDRSWVRGFRRALETHPRPIPSTRRQVRARSTPHGNRL